MSLIKKLKNKITYERESYRLSQEHLHQTAKAMPFPPGYWHMSSAEIQRWRKAQGK